MQDMTNTTPPLALLNTSIITVPDTYTCRPVTPEFARSLVVQYASDGVTDPPYVSAIGHQATADALTEILGCVVPVNRIAFEQQPGQEALVLKLRGRIPEGAILDRAALDEIGFDLWLMTRCAADQQHQQDLREWMALDWLVRTYTPVWLRAAGFGDQAVTMEALPHLRSGIDARPTVGAVLREICSGRVGPGKRTGNEPGDEFAAMAWAAVSAAVWDIDMLTASDAAAVSAAMDSALDTARYAASETPWGAAWRMGCVAIWDVATNASWNSEWNVDPEDAARDALHPHVEALQVSLCDLSLRMR